MNIQGGIKDEYSGLDQIRIFQIELKMNIFQVGLMMNVLGGIKDEYCKWN